VISVRTTTDGAETVEGRDTGRGGEVAVAATTHCDAMHGMTDGLGDPCRNREQLC
jgi:hypothetical protein